MAAAKGQARSGEDLGTFARSFDRRNEPFDPWVVRATWDALEPWVTFRGGRMPLRATDDIGKMLGIEGEDFYDVVKEIRQRTGHTMDEPEANPYYKNLNTVGGLVRFVTQQPKVSDPSRKVS